MSSTLMMPGSSCGTNTGFQTAVDTTCFGGVVVHGEVGSHFLHFLFLWGMRQALVRVVFGI
jgi:hypothetical protein